MGETVLIRVIVLKKVVKGKKNSLKNTCEGVILEADHSMHKYFISYSPSVTLSVERDAKEIREKKKWLRQDLEAIFFSWNFFAASLTD